MLSGRLPVCTACQLRLWPTLLPPRHGLPWQQVRTMAQAQKKQLGRKTLSDKVAKFSPPKSKRNGDPFDKRRPSPFGGMNRTTVPPGVVPPKGRLAAKRQSKGSDSTHSAVPTRSLRPSTRDEYKRRPDSEHGRKKGGQSRQQGDMKHLRMQRALSSIPYKQRATTKDALREAKSFDEYDFLPNVKQSILAQAFPGMTDVVPTPIQRLAIPALLGSQEDKKGRNKKRSETNRLQRFLLAAETGSGKTLAYLLPIIDAIKRAEMAEVSAKAEEEPAASATKKRNPYELEPPPLSVGPESDPARPKAIILLPSAELVDQVGRLFKAFSHTVKLRVSVISASYSATVIRNRLFGNNGVDVIVSTPRLLHNIVESEPNLLSRVTHLVADEADSLLDRSFEPVTSSIIDRSTPSLKQLIFCSATIPQTVDRYLNDRYPDLRRLTTPNLHAIPRRVQLGVVNIDQNPYQGNRDLACADSIWSIGRQVTEHSIERGESVEERTGIKRILVFVNQREKTKSLAEYLESKGIDASALHRDATEERRGEILADFTSSQPSPPTGNKRPNAERKPGSKGATRILPNTKVLVTTDLGSRGLDTVAVRHVILYDVPHTSIDFIHRLGRTGRMGRRGRGIVLVGNKDRKDIVREVREGMFMGKALI